MSGNGIDLSFLMPVAFVFGFVRSVGVGGDAVEADEHEAMIDWYVN